MRINRYACNLCKRSIATSDGELLIDAIALELVYSGKSGTHELMYQNQVDPTMARDEIHICAQCEAALKKLLKV